MLKTGIKGAAFGAFMAVTMAASAAGKPPIFKPDIPPSWSYAQKQVVNKALDALFDACPAINKYLVDIKSASMNSMNMSVAQDRQWAPKLWKRHHWHNVLLLNIATVSNPAYKGFSKLPDPHHLGFNVTFDMGAGDKPGIYMEYEPSRAKKMCGNPHVITIATPAAPSIGMPPGKDSFIPVPRLKVIAQINHVVGKPLE